MYTAGKLIYFDHFYFKNTDENKPKYFLVLKVIDNNVIIASLPSSKNHLPLNQEIIHGCIVIPDSCVNCYIFEANKLITISGWSFLLNTMLYGNWLDDYTVESLNENYVIEGVDYEIIGSLADLELQNVIACFARYSTVKRKYRRLLLM